MKSTCTADLPGVHERLVQLSELVLETIRDATAAFNLADRALAEKAAASGQRTSALSEELVELSMEMLSQRMLDPSAVRTLVACARVGERLARMGEIAHHIAELTCRHYPDSVAPEERQGSFVQMGAQAVDAAELVARLVRTKDLEVADELIEEDRWTDVLQAAAFDAVRAPEWAGGVDRAVDVILTVRYLERFGDQTVAIAKIVKTLPAAEHAA